MKFPFARSIVFYVSTVLVVTISIALGIYGYLNYSEIKSNRIDYLKQNLQIQTGQLSIALALPGWNLDSVGVNRIIESVMLDRNISAVVVDIGDDEKFIRVRDSEWKIIKNITPPTLPQDFKDEKQISFNNEIIGSVQLFFTPKFIQQELNTAVARIAFLTLALDLIIILVIYFLLSRNVLTPLYEI